MRPKPSRHLRVNHAFIQLPDDHAKLGSAGMRQAVQRERDMISPVLKLASVEISTVLPDEYLLMGILADLNADGQTVTFGLIALGALGPAESNLVSNREWATQSYAPIDLILSILSGAVRRSPDNTLESLADETRRSIRVSMLEPVPVPRDLEGAVKELLHDPNSNHANDPVNEFLKLKLEEAFKKALGQQTDPIKLVRRLPVGSHMRRRPADLDRLNKDTWRVRFSTQAALA